MTQPSTTTFENIESAHAYVGLLCEEVDDTTRMIEQEMARASDFTGSRDLDALRLVHYKLHSLRGHLVMSRRLLGDLRTLRRYLLDERRSESALTEGEADLAKQPGTDHRLEQK
jgi:hypothetical protein